MSIAIEPVVWSVLGYPFEGASMVAGLCACLVVRVHMALDRQLISRRSRLTEFTITVLALLFTTGWIILQRPMPFYALLVGTGFGVLGAGVIPMAVRWLMHLAPLAGGDDVDVGAEDSIRSVSSRGPADPV